jgi:itaconate CoA-transferase
MQPLEGVTVVTLEQAVAAPFATRQLADLGARVIKIERPGVGDFARAYDQRVNGLSSHFVWLNRSKESLTLDVKRPESKDVLDRLLQGADVFVQNLAPGAVERLGLDTGTLRQRYPRLIVCGISGYGTTGPFRDRKAYDLLVQAESGLVSITGSETEPAKSAIAVADIAAGMYGFTSVLTALIARGRSGTGTTIEVSMLEALGEWMGYPLYYTTYGGSPLPRTGARHAAIAPYGPFAVSAGDVVYLGLQNEREWVTFCDQVLCRPELARDARFDSNPQRIQHLETLHAAIDAVLGGLSMSEVSRRLDQAGIAYASLNTVEQFAAHPQLAARHRWREVGTPTGPVRALLPPFTIEGLEPRMDPIPETGEHTDAILRELGYDAPTVAAWHTDGVV